MTKDLIKSTLESSYKRENWIDLIRNVFNNGQFNAKPVQIGIAKNDIADNAFEIGSFETADGRIIGIYEIKIKKNINLERNRVGLRQLLRSVYKQVDGAFIVFDQGAKWRFSYVSEINVRDENGKLVKSQTEPKRFTYLLGEGISSRTAIERFNKLLGKGVNLSDIKEAFSVDTLTKEFYRELSDWYFWALQHVEFPNDEEKNMDVRNATSTIRLITRIMFVWFLKQKGLIPDELFDKIELDKILKYNDKKESTYYKAILQNLFFATLNTEMGDENRKFVDRQYGVQGYYRYKRFFKDVDRFMELTKNIPFLNGGLFENLDKNIGTEDAKRIDCFSNRLENETKLTVPDYLFFGDDTVDLSVVYDDKKRKSVEVHGLINILKKYNFTIEENTPLDVEVALDPELLGKVFENLLASYNPETQSTARKQTGSFYTPREVVEYMVDESLKAFLLQKLCDQADGFLPVGKQQVELFGNETKKGQLGLEVKIAKSDSEKVRYEKLLDDLLSYVSNEHGFNEKEIALIISAIDNCKILDPACGSGAFPMGILHKMVHILHKIDPKNKLWKEKQISRVKSAREAASQIQELSIRENILHELDKTEDDIEKAFNNNELDYGRKLYLIENCIYGVDLQAIAVQIAKLRFFISLVVDQTIHDRETNLGIRPLPNLETKFVAANTLLSLEKERTTLFTNQEIDKKKAELKRVRLDHFEAKTPGRKNSLRKKDELLRKEIALMLVNEHELQPNAAKQLANWNPYDQNASSSFFDAEWMFGFQSGFNIIIGNPPYVGQKGHKEMFQVLKASPIGNKYHQRRMDLFYFFFHFGIDNLSANGVLSFITTNYYLTATYSDKLRKHIYESTTVLSLINFNELKIFESAQGQHNLITTLRKGKNSDSIARTCVTNLQGFASETIIEEIFSRRATNTLYYSQGQQEIFEKDTLYMRIGSDDNSSKLDSGGVFQVLNKIQKCENTLKKFCNIEQGIVSGADKVSDAIISEYPDLELSKGDGIFILTKEEIEKLHLTKEELSLIKPVYKNSDLKKWIFKPKKELFLIYLKDEGKSIKLGKNLSKHFEKYKDILVDKKKNCFKNAWLKKIVEPWLMRGNYFVLFYPRNQESFEQPKIVNSRRAYQNIFAYEDKGYYEQSDIVFTTLKENSHGIIELKYLLCVLNSKLIYNWLYYKGKRKGEQLELFQKPLSEIPIVLPNNKVQSLFIQKAEKIIQNKLNQSDSDVSSIEREVDIMVYHLYELTYEEARIIDPTINLEEFSKLKF